MIRQLQRGIGLCAGLMLGVFGQCTGNSAEVPAINQAAPLPLRGHLTKRWTAGSGLPTTKAESILQSSDGYLWVGTQRGFVRFDGNRFYALPEAMIPGRMDYGVPAMAEDTRDRSLWIGTTAGLFHLWNGRLRRFTTDDGLPHNKIWKLVSLKSGDLWMRADWQPVLFRDGKFTHYTTDSGLPEPGIDCDA